MTVNAPIKRLCCSVHSSHRQSIPILTKLFFGAAEIQQTARALLLTGRRIRRDRSLTANQDVNSHQTFAPGVS